MYLEGEQVLAKSSGSDDYEKAKVVGVKGSKYVVKFKSGAERIIGEGDIKVKICYLSQIILCILNLFVIKNYTCRLIEAPEVQQRDKERAEALLENPQVEGLQLANHQLANHHLENRRLVNLLLLSLENYL